MTCSAARNGASSSTYITARAKNDATSDNAPTTGLRWRITTSAKMTATAAKKKKMMNSIIGFIRHPERRRARGIWAGTGSYPALCNEERYEDDVADREGQE